MTDTKHTPTPWEVGEVNDFGGYDCMTAGVTVGPVTLDASDYGQRTGQELTPEQSSALLADANFVSKAVNNHDALVGALRYIGKNWPDSSAAKHARSALAALD